jgi:hypothetical protein
MLALGLLLIGWSSAGSQPARGLRELLIALSAIAMGMQGAMILDLHAGATTTYITSTLITFSTELVGLVRNFREALAKSR